MGAKIKWGDANLLLPNFCVLPAVSSQLSVFSKLCIMNTLLHFLLLLLQLCRSLRNISLGGRILGKSKVIITVGRVRWRHQRAPVLSLASGPPNPKPTTGHESRFFSRSSFLLDRTEADLHTALTRVKACDMPRTGSIILSHVINTFDLIRNSTWRLCDGACETGFVLGSVVKMNYFKAKCSATR